MSDVPMSVVFCSSAVAWLSLAVASSPQTIFPKGQLKTISLPFTGFHSNGTIASARKQAEYAVKYPMDVVYVGGTTSEWPLLAVDERLQLMQEWRSLIPKSGPSKLMVHVGHTSLPEAQRLARRACDLSFDAIMAAPPTIFPALTLELLVEFMAQIFGQCPSLPAYFYHFPALYDDVDFAVADLFRAAEKRIPNLVGAKFSGGLTQDMADFIAAGQVDPDRFGVFSTGLPCLPTFDASAAGCSHGRGMFVYQYEVQEANEFVKAVMADDTATMNRFWGRLEARRNVVARYNLPNIAKRGPGAGAMGRGYQVTGAKAVGNVIGLDVGPSRLPLPSVNASQLESLRQELLQATLMPPLP